LKYMQKVRNLLHIDFQKGDSDPELPAFLVFKRIKEFIDYSGHNSALRVQFSSINRVNRLPRPKNSVRLSAASLPIGHNNSIVAV